MFLRRVGRPLFMMAKVKETTGIEGLEVVPNAREVLIDLYSKTLNDITAVPKEEGYRKNVESFTSQRLKVCQEEEDWENIEKRIGSGQVEELIEEAKDELRLIRNMNKWKPWGVPVKKPESEAKKDGTDPKPKFKTGPLPPEFFQALESVAIKAEEKRLRLEAEERAKKAEEEGANPNSSKAKTEAEPPSEGSGR